MAKRRLPRSLGAMLALGASVVVLVNLGPLALSHRRDPLSAIYDPMILRRIHVGSSMAEVEGILGRSLAPGLRPSVDRHRRVSLPVSTAAGNKRAFSVRGEWFRDEERFMILFDAGGRVVETVAYPSFRPELIHESMRRWAGW